MKNWLPAEFGSEERAIESEAPGDRDAKGAAAVATAGGGRVAASAAAAGLARLEETPVGRRRTAPGASAAD